MGLKRQEIEKPLNNVDFDSFPSLLTIKQVSEIFKVHPNTLRNWDRSGRLKAVRIGPRKDRRYEKSTVQKLYKELYSKGEIEIESQPDSNEVKPTDEGKYILQPGFSFHKVRLYFISRRFSLLVYSAILVGFAFFSIQSIFFAYVYTIRAEEQPLEKYYVTIKPNKVMGWNGQNLAKDISLLSTSKLEEFNEKNSAVYVNEPVTPKKTEAILNVSDGEESIVTTDEEGDNPFVLGEETDTATETITDPADKASETDSILVAEGWQLPGSIPAEALLKNVKVIYSFAADSFDGNEDVMTLEYSLDAGQNWYNLDSFSLFKDISNATNGGFWEFPLEDLTKDSINDFRTRVTYNAVPGDQASTAYLDGVIMEVELEEPNPVNIEIQESVGVEEHDVTTDEEPVIEVEVKEEAFFSFLGAEPKERIVKDVKLVDPDGEKIDVEYEVRSVKDGNTTTAEYAINTDDFDKPGLYRATIVVEQDGIIEIVEQDFTWGVMAINPDQSIYQTGQEALFSIGILDDHGDMVCDADVVLTITNPDRSVETRTTKDGSIVISENCRHKGDFRGPDYYADYLPSVPGTYTLNLRATHQNGMRTIDDSFEAQLSPTYTIKRYGPTRVFPYIYQPMSLTVMAYENFEGEIVEVVPDYFEIETVDDAVIRQVPQGDKTVTEIVWNRTLAEGQSIELIYNFKTPEESPALYLVGPAKIGNNWDEGRQWQMAIDVTYMYLLANTASAASGWTDDTATFDSDFVRGAATFSSTGGGNATHANTVHHNVVSAASADYGGTTCSRRCALVAATDHTHSNTNPTISNANNDPAHYTYYIWKNDTGVPSTIPDNIFAFFDSNPGGSWTQFSAANDRMVKIDNSHTTGGSDTHTHQVTWNSLGASDSVNLLDPVVSVLDTSDDGHTHSAPSAGTTSEETSLYNYVTTLIYEQTNATPQSIPSNLIGLFDGDPGAGWNVISDGVAEDYYQRLIRGHATTEGTQAGTTTHAHDEIVSGNTGTGASQMSAGTGSVYSGESHTHTITTGFDAVSHQPPYVDFVVAQCDGCGATGIDLSGTAFEEDEATEIDGSLINKTVTLWVNGSATACSGGACTDDITADTGAWAITGITAVSGDIITVFLDDETEEGSTVFKSDGTTQTDVDIFQNAVIVRNDTGTSITNTNLESCDRDGGDSDVKFDVGLLGAGEMDVDSDFELHIWTGDTYDPGGKVRTDGTGGDVHVDNSATMYLDTATNGISAEITVDASATLNIQQSTNISGTGAVVDVTGALNITAGTVNIGNSTDEDLKVNSGATVSISGGTTNIADLLDIDGGGVTISSTVDIANDIDMDGGTLAISSVVDVADDFDMDGGTLDVNNGADIDLEGATADFLVDGATTVVDLNDGSIDAGRYFRWNTGATVNLYGGDHHTGAVGGGGNGTWEMALSGNMTFNMISGTNPDVNGCNITASNILVYTTSGIFSTDTVTGGTICQGTTHTEREFYDVESEAHSFYNLKIIENAIIDTLTTETIVLEGDFEIDTGKIFGTSNKNMSVAGNWTNNGTFTAGTGLVTLNGTSEQNLSGTLTGTSAFYDLALTNSSGSYTGCATAITPGVDFDAAATVTNNYTITTNNVKVEYNSGSTYTFTNINWSAASSNDIIFRNSNLIAGTWLLDVSGTQTAVSYVNVGQSDASSGDTIEAYNGTNTNCNNNTNWQFTSIDISGVVYQEDEAANVGAGVTVNVNVNGVYKGTDDTGASGDYAINNVPIAGSGDIITLYLDDDLTYEGTTVYKTDGTDQTNVDIYQNAVIVRDDSGILINNIDLEDGDRDAGDDDIKFIVNTGAMLVDSGYELHVWTGDEYDPGGSITTQGTGGDVHVDDSATLDFDTATNTIAAEITIDTSATLNVSQTTNVNGTGAVVDVTGTLNHTAATFTIGNGSDEDLKVNNGGAVTLSGGTTNIKDDMDLDGGTTTVSNTVNLSSASANETIDMDGGTLVVNTGADINCDYRVDMNTASTLTLNDGSLDTVNYWLIYDGTLNLNGGDHNIGTGGFLYLFPNVTSVTFNMTGGAITTKELYVGATGTFNQSSVTGGTINVGLSGQTNSIDIDQAAQFWNITIEENTSSTDSTVLIDVLNDLTINSGKTLTAVDETFEINNIWDNQGGTFTAGSSTVTLTDSSGGVAGSTDTTFNNLTIDTCGSCSVGVGVSGGTDDPIVTGTLTVQVSEYLDLPSGRSITVASTGSITETAGGFTGEGRLIFKAASGFPTTPNYGSSTIVRFDSTDNSQTLPANTWAPNFEIYGNNTSNTVTAASGTLTFQKDVSLIQDGSGETIFDMGTNDPTVTMDKDLDIGANAEFQSTSGILNLKGDFTKTGDFTASGGTIVLNGTSQQTIDAGDGMSIGGEFFHNMTISNTSGTDPDTAPGVIFTGGTIDWWGTFTITTQGVMVQFAAGEHYTNWYKLDINGQATDGVYFRSSSAGTQFLFDFEDYNSQGQSVSNVNVKDSNACSGAYDIDVTDGTSTNAGNNDCWNWPPIDVSGVIYTGPSESAYNCSADNLTVRVKVDGAGDYSATCISGVGEYTVSGVDLVDDDDIVTIFLDDETPNATTVLRINDYSVDQTGIDLYQDHLIARHEDAGPVTNTDLDYYDSGSDSDIVFTVTTGNLTVGGSIGLFVWGGDTFAPGGTVTTTPDILPAFYGGDISIDTSATLNMGANALSIGGNLWNDGTLTLSAGQTTTFTATGTDFIIDHGSAAFRHVVFNGSGGGWSFNSAVTIDHNLTVTAGTLSGTNDIQVDDNVTGNGTINLTGGTFKIVNGSNSLGGDTAWTFYDLKLDHSGTSSYTTTATGTGAVTITHQLLIDQTYNIGCDCDRSHLLNGGSKTWILSGSGTDASRPYYALGSMGSSGIVPATSTFRYTGTTDSDIESDNYYVLELKPSGGSNPTYDLFYSYYDIDSNFTIGDGTNSVTVTGTTYDNAVDLEGDFSCTTGASTNTVITGAGTWNVAGNYNLSNCDSFTATTGHELIMDGTSKVLYASGKILYDLTITGSAESNGGDFTVHDVTIGGAGAFTSTSGILSVSGSWSNSNTFTHNSGTVQFTTTATATITGNTTFNNFTVTGVGAAKTMTFTAGSTQTVSGTWTVTGASGQIVTLESSTTSVWTINPTAASVTYVDVSYSTNTGVAFCATYSNDGLNNTNWSISTGATCGVNISGVLYSDEGSTNIDCTAGNKSVRLGVNGNSRGIAECTADTGAYSFTDISVNEGEIITVYIDDETEEGTTVAVSDGSTVSDMDIYQNWVVVRADYSTMDNGKMDTGDDDDDDVKYSVSGLNITIDSGFSVHVWAGDTYEMNGILVTQGGGNIHITSSATWSAGGNQMTVNGYFENKGTFTPGSNTVIFDSSSANQPIDIGSSSFYNVTLDGSGSWSAADNILDVDNDLIIKQGTLNNGGGTADVGVNGSVQCETTCGTINLSSGTFTQSVAAAENFGTNVAGSTSWYFNNLTFNSSSGTPTITFNGTGSGSIFVSSTGTLATTNNGTSLVVDNETNDRALYISGNVAIGTDTTLQASSGAAFQVGGNWSNSGTFTSGTGVVAFAATDGDNTLSGTMTGTSDFYELSFFGIGGQWSANNDIAVDNDLNMTNGTLVGSSNITVDDNVTGDGTINLSGGTFTVVNGSNSFGGATGWTFNNLTFQHDGSLNLTTSATGTGNIEISNLLTLEADIVGEDKKTHIIEAGSKTWILSGSGTVLDDQDNYSQDSITPQTSTFRYTGIDATTIEQNHYHHLEFTPASGTPTYTFVNQAQVYITGNLDINATIGTVTERIMMIGDGGPSSSSSVEANGQTLYDFIIDSNGESLTTTIQTDDLIVSHELDVDTGDTLDISTGRILTWTGSGFILNGTVDGGIDGQGRLTVNTATLLPTSGTIDATVRFDASAGTTDTMPARAYGSDVEIYSNNTTKTIAGAAGTYTIAGDLDIMEDNTGTTTFDLNTNDPTLTVSGSVSIATDTILSASSANPLIVNEHWTNSGTLTHNNGRVTFTVSGDAKSGDIDSTGAIVDDFYDITFDDSGNGGEAYLESALYVDHDLSIVGGTLDVKESEGNAIYIGGDWTNADTFDAHGGKVTFTAASVSAGTVTIDSTGAVKDDFYEMFFDDSADGDTFQLESDLDANSLISIDGGTLDTKSGLNYTIYDGGNWSCSDTFEANSSEVEFDATDTGNTITVGTGNFYDVEFNGSGGGWSFSNGATIDNDVAVTLGEWSGTQDIIINGGDFDGNGTVNMSSGTISLSGTGNFGGNSAWAFNNLSFMQSTCSTKATTATGSGSITVNGTLTTTMCFAGDNWSHYINAGSKTWILTAAGTPFTNEGGLYGDTSTFRYTGNGATNITSPIGITVGGGYYNLELKPSGTSTYTMPDHDGMDINNNLVIGDGTNTVTVDATVYNGGLDIGGSVTCAGTGTNNINTGTGTYQVTGDVNLTNCSVTATSGHTFEMDGDGVALTADGNTLYDVETSGSGAISFADALITTNDISVGGATSVSTSSDVTVNGGDLSGTGDFDASGGTVVLLDDGALHGSSSDWTLNNLTLNQVASCTAGCGAASCDDTTTMSGSGDLTVSGTLLSDTCTYFSGEDHYRSHAISPGSQTVILSGTGQPLQAEYIYGTSTLRYTGTGATVVGFAETEIVSEFYNMELQPSGGSPTYTIDDFHGAVSPEYAMMVHNNFTIGDGSNNATLDSTTENAHLSVAGNFGCTAGATNTVNTGNRTWTVSGDLDLSDCTLTATADHTFIMNGTSKSITPAGQTVYNFQAASTGSIAQVGAMDINGTFDLLNTATFTQAADNDLNVAGNFTLAIGTTFTKASGSGELILDGDLTFTDSTAGLQNMGVVQIGASPDTTNLASDFKSDELRVGTLDEFYTNGYDLDIDGNILIDGVMDAEDDGEGDDTYINLTGDFTVSSGARFYPYTSTLTFLAGTGTSNLVLSPTCNTCELNNLVVDDGGGGSLIVEVEDPIDCNGSVTITDGTLDVVSGENNAITVGGDWTNGDIFTARSGTVTFVGDAIGAETNIIDSTGAGTDDFNNVVLNDGADGDTFLLDSTLDVNGNLTITGGTLDVKNAVNNPIYIGGNWANSDIFESRAGTVYVDGTSQQTFSGNMTAGTNGAFYNLTVTNASASNPDVIFSGSADASNNFTATTASTQLQFNAASTYTFNNIIFNGQAEGTRVYLRSSSTGTQWNLITDGSQSVSNTDVRDSNACGGDTVDATDGTNFNATNNDCWDFNTISFSISDVAIGFGSLDFSNDRYATSDGNGAGAPEAAHTLQITCNADNGYAVTYKGSTLTSGSNTIDVATITDSSTGTTGLEQFAMSLANGAGDAAITAGYDYEDGPDWKFVADPADPIEIISESGPTATETISVYYISNISPQTEAGSYSTNITFIITATF